MQHPDVAAYDPGFGPLVRTRVRIATWNLWGRYGPWEARMPVIIENLRAINADIIALQEVWEDDITNQADEIADCARMHRARVRGEPRTRRRALGQRGDLALAHRAQRSPRAPRKGSYGAEDDEGEERCACSPKWRDHAGRSSSSARISAGRTATARSARSR